MMPLMGAIPILFLSTLSLRRATLRVLDGSKSSIISIHALLAESDAGVFLCYLDNIISIHALLAESDRCYLRSSACHAHFYPRSPCGERHPLETLIILTKQISIHALLAESDDTESAPNKPEEKFLSTLSLRRATLYHLTPSSGTFNFYPRSPCGERLWRG